MKKEKLRIIVTSNNSKDEYNVLGIYDREKQKLEYQENRNLVTHVMLDLNDRILTRDNRDYYLEYRLLENEITENKIDIKELNQSIIVKIKTKKFNILENKVEIVYTLLDGNETVEYIIEF